MNYCTSKTFRVRLARRFLYMAVVAASRNLWACRVHNFGRCDIHQGAQWLRAMDKLTRKHCWGGISVAEGAVGDGYAPSYRWRWAGTPPAKVWATRRPRQLTHPAWTLRSFEFSMLLSYVYSLAARAPAAACYWSSVLHGLMENC